MSSTKFKEHFPFVFFLTKHIVEIKILYNILISYVHKIILLITKLRSLICRVWLATPKKDPEHLAFEAEQAAREP